MHVVHDLSHELALTHELPFLGESFGLDAKDESECIERHEETVGEYDEEDGEDRERTRDVLFDDELLLLVLAELAEVVRETRALVGVHEVLALAAVLAFVVHAVVDVHFAVRAFEAACACAVVEFA